MPTVVVFGDAQSVLSFTSSSGLENICSAFSSASRDKVSGPMCTRLPAGDGQIDYAAPEHRLQVQVLRSLFEATLAEGDLLNPRVQANGRRGRIKQKISGCLWISDGADIYCIIRSYLATLNKQGAKLFDALTQAFQGAPVQPRFG